MKTFLAPWDRSKIKCRRYKLRFRRVLSDGHTLGRMISTAGMLGLFFLFCHFIFVFASPATTVPDHSQLESMAGYWNAEGITTNQSGRYHIPLSEELQQYTLSVCDKFEFDPALAFAVMFIETNFTPEVNQPDGVGIMAIHPTNLPELSEKLGIDNLSDPKQNILAGCYYLSRYLKTYEDTEKALMAYNCGAAGAQKLWDQGVEETEYSNKVQQAMANIISSP